MVGYSRLIEADEIGTIQRLKTHRFELFDPRIREFRGRIVKEMGDGVLAVFPSVIDAVQCAVSIQKEMEEREAISEVGKRICFRIGINLGDIITENEDIFGDGVNIAARLEQMAEPGGILISGTAYDQLKSNVAVGYESLGQVKVKNIQSPVRAYRILTDPDLAGKVIGETVSERFHLSGFAIVFAILLAMFVGGGMWWWSLGPDIEPADMEKAAYSLPDKPSIVVLPFANLSEDQDQEYFADGFTEDLITNIAQSRELFVISRNSTFAYKGQAVSVTKVAEELGVRYVLEGSVRRIGANIRITAQLIDAENGSYIWAKRYDRPATSVFDVQDELSREIAGTLLANISKAVLAGAALKRPDDLSAYEYVLRARKYYDEGGRKAQSKARALAEQAIAIDPKYAHAHAMLGNTHNNDYIRQWGGPDSLDLAEAAARKSIELDPLLSAGHELLGRVLLRRKRHRESIQEIRKAIELNPNESQHYASLADAMTFSNHPAEAVEIMKTAMRLNPFYPSLENMYYGRALYFTGRYEEAVTELELCRTRSPRRRSCYMYLAPSYAELGEQENANLVVAKLLEIDPDFSIGNSVIDHLPYVPEAMTIYVSGLRKAGVPE